LCISVSTWPHSVDAGNNHISAMELQLRIGY
jgi:hypothetical protein